MKNFFNFKILICVFLALFLIFNSFSYVVISTGHQHIELGFETQHCEECLLINYLFLQSTTILSFILFVLITLNLVSVLTTFKLNQFKFLKLNALQRLNIWKYFFSN